MKPFSSSIEILYYFYTISYSYVNVFLSTSFMCVSVRRQQSRNKCRIIHEIKIILGEYWRELGPSVPDQRTYQGGQDSKDIRQDRGPPG